MLVPQCVVVYQRPLPPALFVNKVSGWTEQYSKRVHGNDIYESVSIQVEQKSCQWWQWHRMMPMSSCDHQWWTLDPYLKNQQSSGTYRSHPENFGLFWLLNEKDKLHSSLYEMDKHLSVKSLCLLHPDIVASESVNLHTKIQPGHYKLQMLRSLNQL